MLTEFAMYPDGWCTPGPNDLACMRHTLDVLENHGHGYLGWEYATIWNGQLMNDTRVYEMARPFPMAIGGHVEGYAFERSARTFVLNFTVAPGAPANASTTVVFASLGLYYAQGFTAAVVAAPADAVHSMSFPCFAGSGAGGSFVSPPAMNCAPATPSPTVGAPAPYAYGYAVLDLTSASGGLVSLRLDPL